MVCAGFIWTARSKMGGDDTGAFRRCGWTTRCDGLEPVPGSDQVNSEEDLISRFDQKIEDLTEALKLEIKFIKF